MKLWQKLKRPPYRTVLLLFLILAVIGLAYLVWQPGSRVRDGRHDRRTNGIWLQHGWLGDDSWFTRNNRDKALFRDDARMQQLADLLSSHGIKYVFPHACPCNPSGSISPIDAAQTEKFLDHFGRFAVVPWIGGVWGSQCFPDSPAWRAKFVASAADLITSHPRLAGVQVNIEPWPTGSSDFLLLLDDLRRALPKGKIISVAAYPPPTRWQQSTDVHWDEAYFRQVAARADQLAPMMYDTGIKIPKCYQYLMSSWTHDVLNWSGNTQVLLGVPAYNDPGVGYHSPRVENLSNALRGIHAGLNKFDALPTNYAGASIYCEWEMDQNEWQQFKTEFEKTN